MTAQVYIIEANPRASRTVPFVAKAIGHPVAKYASLLMSGQTLPELDFTEEPKLNHVAVKEAVLPFDKFQGEHSQYLRHPFEDQPLHALTRRLDSVSAQGEDCHPVPHFGHPVFAFDLFLITD